MFFHLHANRSALLFCDAVQARKAYIFGAGVYLLHQCFFFSTFSFLFSSIFLPAHSRRSRSVVVSPTFVVVFFFYYCCIPFTLRCCCCCFVALLLWLCLLCVRLLWLWRLVARRGLASWKCGACCLLVADTNDQLAACVCLPQTHFEFTLAVLCTRAGTRFSDLWYSTTKRGHLYYIFAMPSVSPPTAYKLAVYLLKN